MTTDARENATDEVPEYDHLRGLLSLWVCVLGPPLLMLLNLQLGYMMTPWACRRDGQLWMHAVTLVLLLVDIGVGVHAYRTWSRLGREWSPRIGGTLGRSRLMAALGILESALFALVIIAQWMPNFFLSACQ